MTYAIPRKPVGSGTRYSVSASIAFSRARSRVSDRSLQIAQRQMEKPGAQRGERLGKRVRHGVGQLNRIIHIVPRPIELPISAWARAR